MRGGTCAAQVHLGNRVTFLPTPLRNWWGRPNLLRLWFALSIYMILVMVLTSQPNPFPSLPFPASGARVDSVYHLPQWLSCPKAFRVLNFILEMRSGTLPFTRSLVSCRA